MDFLFKFYWVTVLVLQLLLDNTEASVGDNSAYYRNCREKCEKRKCQNSNYNLNVIHFLLPLKHFFLDVLLFKKGMEETISDHLIDICGTTSTRVMVRL